MHNDGAISELIAEHLLQINAIKLNVEQPFTWSSGLKAPIYCDNRRVWSFPELRSLVADSLAVAVRNEFPDVELIAGVATGAIAPGVLVAERLQLPFVYVRSTPKAHGLGARVEGFAAEGLKTVVIEDLVSTAGSSILACDALKADKLKVLGMAAIFTYDLDMAEQNLKKAGIPLITLSNYHDLVRLAKSKGMITDEEQTALMQWRLNPSSWSDARQHN